MSEPTFTAEEMHGLRQYLHDSLRPWPTDADEDKEKRKQLAHAQCSGLPFRVALWVIHPTPAVPVEDRPIDNPFGHNTKGGFGL